MPVLGRSPDTANGDDIRRFQLAQVEQGAQPPKMNSQASALRFFLTITLGRADLAHQLARTHYPRKLPRVLAAEQVARLIEAAPGPGLKYKTAHSIAYGAGLRGGEVVMLRVGDIDTKRMLIRVEMGKGRKDRHAMLSPQLLSLLRAWWLQCRSRGWLFRVGPLRPISVRQLNRVCHAWRPRPGLGSWVTPHTLRHSFATHLERYRRAGDPSAAGPCQAGHTTARYTRRRNVLRTVMSPLDRLALPTERPPITPVPHGRQALEVADILRHGPRRDANRGHVSLGQLKVMSAIEALPPAAALGRHVMRCENGACALRPSPTTAAATACPKCQGAAARQVDGGAGGGAAAVPYFRRVHAAGAIGDIAYQNKAVI